MSVNVIVYFLGKAGYTRSFFQVVEFVRAAYRKLLRWQASLKITSADTYYIIKIVNELFEMLRIVQICWSVLSLIDKC